MYTVNWIMFFVIMVSICKHTQDAGAKGGSKVSFIKNNVIIALTLAVIFGLGWGIGLAATSGPAKEFTLTFQIIFSILVGLQGTLIFILHGIRNQDVRNVWKQWFSRIGGKSLLDSIMSMAKTSSSGIQSSALHGENSYSMSLSQKKPINSESEHIVPNESVVEETSKVDLTLQL